MPSSRARVARASRIYVEGRHDAELVEKIWGDDLRDVGVVVEYLEGVDHLPEIMAEFAPGPGRRLGVLVDHLVPGSKESRIAAGPALARRPGRRPPVHRHLAGRQAVRGRDRLLAGRPARDAVEGGGADRPRLGRATPAAAWQRILRSVHTFTDLEPELLGRVEELIDFVDRNRDELTVAGPGRGGCQRVT